MAASSNKTTDKGKDWRNVALSRSFKERLDQLGCPYTDGVEETWIAELIFKPGEPRIRLLQWLFSKFDSRLNDLLDPQYASTESKMDSRLQRLLFVASTVGLCRYDDIDLIRGATTVTRQCTFMDQLLDLVCIMDAAEDPQTKALRSPGIVSDALSLDEQFLQDCNYIDNLASQESVNTIFSPRLNLMPLDLQRQIDVMWVEKGHDKNKPPKPDLQNVAQHAQQVTKDLERQKSLLEELQKNFNYQEADPAQIEKVSRTTQLVLSELSQLVVGFSYCYENEMCHWCNKSPPALTQLGPAFKRVHTLLQQFVTLLDGLGSIRLSYSSLNRDASQRISSFAAKHDKVKDLAAVGQAALESFQECVGVLDESMQRREADLSSTSTMRSSVLKA